MPPTLPQKASARFNRAQTTPVLTRHEPDVHLTPSHNWEALKSQLINNVRDENRRYALYPQWDPRRESYHMVVPQDPPQQPPTEQRLPSVQSDAAARILTPRRARLRPTETAPSGRLGEPSTALGIDVHDFAEDPTNARSKSVRTEHFVVIWAYDHPRAFKEFLGNLCRAENNAFRSNKERRTEKAMTI